MKKKQNSKYLRSSAEKFWLGLGVMMAIFITLSTFLVVRQSQKDTTPEQADASYNLTPYLQGIEFTAKDMYVVQDGVRTSPPKKGSWTFKVIRQDNGSYPQSPKGILADKKAVTVIGKYQQNGGDGLKLDIRFRFNSNGQDWWVNGAFINRQKKGNVLLTTLYPFYPDNKKDEGAWESEVFNQIIGEHIAFGEAFEGDITVPLYSLYGNSATTLKQGNRWGMLVVKEARIKAFANQTATESIPVGDDTAPDQSSSEDKNQGSNKTQQNSDKNYN